MMIPLFALIALAVLIAVIGVKTLLFSAAQDETTTIALVQIDEEPVAERLSEAVKLVTLSTQDASKFDPEPFLAFHRFLETSYPLIHQHLERTVINDYSLLYQWPGSDASLKPVVFAAHIDVVPVEPGTEKDWQYDAFSGTIADGFVWGRGSMDMKSTLTGLMESVENLLQNNFKPRRSMYFAFGHDEEIGGTEGAAKIVDHLKANDVRAAFSMDEGMVILDENLSPLSRQVAVIGIAEKGYLTVKIEASAKGGHSSMPPGKTALGMLSNAVSRLEKNQLPASLSGVGGRFFDGVGPYMHLLQKTLFANRWLFGKLILSKLVQQNVTNAMTRTTTAPTIMDGGVKENVLPTMAHALVNFRILPGDSIAGVMAHARRVIDDPDIKLTAYGPSNSEPSPVAGVDALGYKAIKQTVQQLFPGVVVTPGLVLGGTDSKHYATIADDAYRFAPVVYGAEDPGRIHGTNERVDIAGYVKSIQYYIQLMKTVGDSPAD